MTVLVALSEPAKDEFRRTFTPQLDYFRQKVSLPTKGWRDLDGRAHDRAFVVAGVEKEAVLSELRQAIDKAIEKGTTLEEFRRDFDKTVEKHGWIGGAGEDRQNWRTRVIYETNVRASYQAGRLKQMRDPAVLELRPWWMYEHAQLRTPEAPRPAHLGWDGTILRHDDPWWLTHFGPNGWLCTCGVRPLSKRERDREQEKRSKPAGPDLSAAAQSPARQGSEDGRNRLCARGHRLRLGSYAGRQLGARARTVRAAAPAGAF